MPIRLLVLLEGLSFAIASLVHSGRIVRDYEHPQARIAEGVIALILMTGLVLTWMKPILLRPIALAVQGFALLGTLVGIFTIVVGVGPRTVPDVTYHVAIVLVLLWGLRVATRVRP